MTAPDWALTLAYWLHMLATVAWIGGLAALAFLIWPASQRALEGSHRAELLEQVQRRLDLIAWFSLLVLAGTGLFQMSAHPNYEGFLSFGNRWAIAILIKHLVILGMVAVSAYLSWGVMPGLRRLALRKSQGLEVSQAQHQQLSKTNARLLYINLGLGILVLALTALARVS